MIDFSEQYQKDTSRVDWLKAQVAEYGYAADKIVSLLNPYVEGLDNLPADGRVLLVANHTLSPNADVLLAPYLAGRHLGKQVRQLAHRAFGNIRNVNGLTEDLFDAAGAVIGSPENASRLMQANEPILVFPGGGRDLARGKDELNQIVWGDRKGFARIAVEHNYPIVPVTLVGPDYFYQVLTTRDGLWGKVAGSISKRLSGMEEMPALTAGIGFTPIPYPQRLYLRFSPPIATTKPQRVSNERWVTQVREETKAAIETSIADLLEIRAQDPYRHMAPWARERAITPDAAVVTA